jgi:hypothetical protein
MPRRPLIGIYVEAVIKAVPHLVNAPETEKDWIAQQISDALVKKLAEKDAMVRRILALSEGCPEAWVN